MIRNAMMIKVFFLSAEGMLSIIMHPGIYIFSYVCVRVPVIAKSGGKESEES